MTQGHGTFAPLIRKVAVKLLGEPDHGKPGADELRWGSRGSFKVDVPDGVWYANDGKRGGGVLDLIMRERNCDKADALKWLEGEGLIEPLEKAAKTFYDYADETGAVLFRVERLGKGNIPPFVQHGPDGHGGFVCRKGCMTGVRKVPYRLDKLVKADPSALVFWTEGEKDCDRLISLGLVATTNPGGAAKFNGLDSAIAKHFPGRRVVILEDNDEAGANHVAAGIAALRPHVAAVAGLLLSGLPPKGDVSDWLIAGGSRDELVSLAEAALQAGPIEQHPGKVSDWHPVDIWARYEAPDLPRNILPAVIERFAVSHGETMGVDPGGLAMSALAVCAAAIPDRICLQVKRHDPTWRESARLWVALIGAPSTKKSPIMNAALRPLAKIDAQLFREFAIKQEIYDALPAQERKSTPKPAQRRLRISDATVEAAQEVLKDSPDGVLSQQDELSGWFGAMDKYAAGKGAMADRGFWLQAFNGGPYALNRVSRGASLIPNLSISVLGGIQPDPLRRIVADAVDDGLIQRLLPVILKPAVMGTDEPQGSDVRSYDELIRQLTMMSPPGDGDEGLLHFSPEAQLIRRRLEARHLEMAAAEVISPKLASHFGKYDGIFARLCILWHCVENAEVSNLPRIIPRDTVERVEAFLHSYIAPSAIAFYTSVLGLSDDHEALIELASFILSHKMETVQHRDCQRATSTLKALTADQSRKLFEKLESLSWVETTAPAPKSNTPRWLVNPSVHDLFADRGRKEKERREKARAALMTVFGGNG